MNEQFRVAQKIGLMFHHDTPLPEDIKTWAISQLNANSPALGIKTFNSKISPWPKSFQPDLNGRIKLFIRSAEIEQKLSSDPNADPNYKLQEKSDFENFMGNRDVLKFAHRNIYGKDQVRLRFMSFWINHFTISGDNSEQVSGHAYDEAILANLNGSFDLMLYKVTSHPGMLTFLDNWVSSGPNSKYTLDMKRNGAQAGLNDNLARELMELHTVSPAAKYTETDINNAAKVLAGWGTYMKTPLDELNKLAKTTDHWNMYKEDWAEPGNKRVLGKTIYAGKGGLRQLTDFLASHENTILFLSHKLAEHFISDNPSKSDINYIASAWRESNGNLDQIHSAVIERAIQSKEPKFQWPIIWLFQTLRLSKATYFHGWDEIWGPCNHCPDDPDRDAKVNYMTSRNIFKEIGQSFWHSRQPNGYSSKKDDWVSGEMFDRRIRFAEAIYNAGNPQFTSDQIMDRIGAHKSTRNLVKSMGMKEKNRFIALMCSPELMGLEYV